MRVREQLTTVISGDTHLEIDSKSWIDRIPAQYRDRAPRVVRTPDGADAWLVEGAPLQDMVFSLYAGKGRDTWAPFKQRYDDSAGTGPAKQRLAEQDIDGIDAEVLFPAPTGRNSGAMSATTSAISRSSVRTTSSSSRSTAPRTPSG